MTLIAPTLQAFFSDRLVKQMHASPRTIASYRDTLSLLLRFVRDTTGKARQRSSGTSSTSRSSARSSSTSKPSATTAPGRETYG